MRVTGKAGRVGSSPSVGGAKPASGPAASPGAGSIGAVQGDDLAVSGTASFVAVARARIAGLPDVRTEKVEAIRAQLEADSYHPDGEAVADGIIRDHTPPRRDP